MFVLFLLFCQILCNVYSVLLVVCLSVYFVLNENSHHDIGIFQIYVDIRRLDQWRIENNNNIIIRDN